MRDQTSDLDLLPEGRLWAIKDDVDRGIVERRGRRRRRHRLVAAGLAVILVGGGTTAGAVMIWQTNEHGQTYGRGDLDIVDPADGTVIEPDLIQAVGWDGDRRVAGYVLSSDLTPEFANPDEVAAWLEDHPPTEDRIIPLYDENMNQIGIFVIEGVTSPQAPQG